MVEYKYDPIDIYDEATVKLFDGMYVDFYLEDDMFEVEGKFFTIEDDDHLYIEVHDAVMHILEMAGKELRVDQVGELFIATRPDDHRFNMAINRVYYQLEDPTAEDLLLYHERDGIWEFFLKLTDVMIKYDSKKNKWILTKNKINMYYIGDILEYDTLEELFAENPDDLKGTWQAVVYEAYEEESDYTSDFAILFR